MKNHPKNIYNEERNNQDAAEREKRSAKTRWFWMRLQGFWILKAKASRKNCISMGPAAVFHGSYAGICNMYLRRFHSLCTRPAHLFRFADIPVSAVARFPFLPCLSFLRLFLSFHSWWLSFVRLPATLIEYLQQIETFHLLYRSVWQTVYCFSCYMRVFGDMWILYHECGSWRRQGLFGAYLYNCRFAWRIRSILPAVNSGKKGAVSIVKP